MGRVTVRLSPIADTMPRYEFPDDEPLDDHVPNDEDVERVSYQGGTEVVVTAKSDERHSGSDLDVMSRSELYSLGKEHDVDLEWSGDSADTRQEMIDKIHSEAGDEL